MSGLAQDALGSGDELKAAECRSSFRGQGEDADAFLGDDFFDLIIEVALA